jgi:hypothetical protein
MKHNWVFIGASSYDPGVMKFVCSNNGCNSRDILGFHNYRHECWDNITDFIQECCFDGCHGDEQ